MPKSQAATDARKRNVMRTIQQQIDALEPDAKSTWALMWEECVTDRIPVERAAAQFGVPVHVARHELSRAAKRLRYNNVFASRYPLGELSVRGLAQVPPAEHNAAMAASVIEVGFTLRSQAPDAANPRLTGGAHGGINQPAMVERFASKGE